MYVEINLFTASALVLVFAILLLLSHSKRTPNRPRSSAHDHSKIERRVHPRYQTSLRVKYKTTVEEGISWIKDISAGGARLFLNDTLKGLVIGQPLELEVNLPQEAAPIFVKGDIVWSAENDAGFRFIEIVQDDIEKIIRFVNNEDE